MLTLPFIVRGFILGFSIAAPVGPIGVLCIRRTLTQGRLTGFLSGLGAATADAFYGAIAAFGLTAISGFLNSQQLWLRLAGGLFLLYLGGQTFFTKPSERAAEAKASNLFQAYLSTVFLTLTNPATIISFTVIFAGLGLSQTDGNLASAAELVLGVFLGSSAWWLTLSGLVGALRERFSPQAMLWVNRLAGVVIVVFGIIALYSLTKLQ
jgi:threonine/homoserine/homoserine lactone efflux protein